MFHLLKQVCQHLWMRTGPSLVPRPTLCQYVGGKASQRSALACTLNHPGQLLPVPVQTQYEPALVSVCYTTVQQQSLETEVRQCLPQISSLYRALHLSSSPLEWLTLSPLKALPNALGKIQNCSMGLPTVCRALGLPQKAHLFVQRCPAWMRQRRAPFCIHTSPMCISACNHL